MSRTMPAAPGLRAESVTRRSTTPTRRRRGGERHGAGSLLPATTFTAGAAVLISDYAWRPVALAVHLLVPVLVYFVIRGLGVRRRSAFLGALVYITNTSFYFFHSLFSYETLSILLILATAAILTWSPRRRIGPVEAALLITLVFATTVTHHVSSYLLAAGLALTWVAGRLLRRPQAGLGAVPLVALAAPVAWLLVRAPHTVSYLSSAFAGRLHGVIRVLSGAHGAGHRQLFGQSTGPLAEQHHD